MKKVAFDARLVTHPGIGRYIRSLLGAMLEAGREDRRFILLGPPEKLNGFRNHPRVEVRPCRVPIYGAHEALGMPRFWKDADLVHVPHFNVPWRLPPRLVVTIHDLIYFHVKAYRPFPFAHHLLDCTFRRIARSARRIITVSDATRRDCEKRFGGMRGKTRTIHEAADPFFAAEDPPSPRPGVPYILYVGSIREHKNVQGLMDAFEKVTSTRGIKAELVLVGGLDARFNRKYAFSRRLEQNPRIRRVEAASDHQLKPLYRNAACLVLPSFYEGFGLPAVEAMACGTPVIASSAASLPEVVGEAGLFFDPRRIDDLEQLLYNVLTDKELRQNLSQKGRDRARAFSWQRAASETLQVYDEVLR